MALRGGRAGRVAGPGPRQRVRVAASGLGALPAARYFGSDAPAGGKKQRALRPCRSVLGSPTNVGRGGCSGTETAERLEWRINRYAAI